MPAALAAELTSEPGTSVGRPWRTALTPIDRKRSKSKFGSSLFRFIVSIMRRTGTSRQGPGAAVILAGFAAASSGGG
jgi:hypothetical protein